MTRRGVLHLLCAAALAAGGCTVGPDYERPEVVLPPVYRGPDVPPLVAGQNSFGDLGWWKVFQDPMLQDLVRTALVQNHDLQVAVARIRQAQAQVTVSESSLYPSVDAAARAPYVDYVGDDRPEGTSPYRFTPEAGLGLSWELDLWGKIRRDTEAAQAELLAAVENRHAVMTLLVAEVVSAYFDLRELDLELEITRQSLEARAASRDLVQARLDGGVAGVLDLRQSEVLVYTAARTIPDIQRRIQQTETLIHILLGTNPGPIPRGRPLAEQISAPPVPPGLPSDLLSRRPDIRGAEQQLIAANARIGVAKALLYPQLTISGFGGLGEALIGGASYGPYGVFDIIPLLTLPIFNMGRLDAGVEFSWARAQEAVVRYRQTILRAIGEVSDALVEIRKRREFREQQESLAATLQDASEVAQMRYEGGVSSYLEVLDTERQYFDAQLDLARARRDECLGVVFLYRALGGGWLPESLPEPEAAELTTD